MDDASIKMSLQSEGQYIHWDVPGVDKNMGFLEEATVDDFLPTLLERIRF